MYVCMYVWIYVFMHTHRVYKHVSKDAHVMHIYICVCIQMCIHTYIYIYTHIDHIERDASPDIIMTIQPTTYRPGFMRTDVHS